MIGFSIMKTPTIPQLKQEKKSTNFMNISEELIWKVIFPLKFSQINNFFFTENRIIQLLSSPKSLENFYDTRKELIAEKFTNEALIKEMINKSISKIFEEKLTQKFEKFKENCQLTHYQARKDFFLNMKHLVFNRNFLFNEL